MDCFTAMAQAVYHSSLLLHSYFVLGIQGLEHIMKNLRGNLTLLILNIKEPNKMVCDRNHIQPQKCLVIFPAISSTISYDGLRWNSSLGTHREEISFWCVINRKLEFSHLSWAGYMVKYCEPHGADVGKEHIRFQRMLFRLVIEVLALVGML